MIMLSIDPSIRSLGWALWEMGARVALLESGTWHPSKKPDAGCRHRQLCRFIQEQIMAEKVELLVLETSERPGYGGPGGMGVKQATVYARSVGNVEGAAIAAGARVEAVDVRQWKGNGRKESTLILCRAYGIEPGTLDESDAVGLGLWWIGRNADVV